MKSMKVHEGKRKELSHTRAASLRAVGSTSRKPAHRAYAPEGSSPRDTEPAERRQEEEV